MYVENVEVNGHIKKALAQHKDALVGNVENQTTLPRCAELQSSQNKAQDNKKV